MRSIAVFSAVVLLSVGCGGDQPPPVPGASGESPTSAAPPPEIPAPAAADLHGAPPVDGEELQELYDISRDLQAVARSEGGAVADLAEDLSRFAPSGETGPDAKALAERIGRALGGRGLDEAAGRRVAVLLYVAMNAGGLTPEQRAAASTQLREILASAGAAAADADAVAAQIR